MIDAGSWNRLPKVAQSIDSLANCPHGELAWIKAIVHLLPFQRRRYRRARLRAYPLRGRNRLASPVLQEVQVDPALAVRRAARETCGTRQLLMDELGNDFRELSSMIVVVPGPQRHIDVQASLAGGLAETLRSAFSKVSRTSIADLITRVIKVHFPQLRADELQVPELNDMIVGRHR